MPLGLVTTPTAPTPTAANLDEPSAPSAPCVVTYRWHGLGGDTAVLTRKEFRVIRPEQLYVMTMIQILLGDVRLSST